MHFVTLLEMDWSAGLATAGHELGQNLHLSASLSVTETLLNRSSTSAKSAVFLHSLPAFTLVGIEADECLDLEGAMLALSAVRPATVRFGAFDGREFHLDQLLTGAVFRAFEEDSRSLMCGHGSIDTATLRETARTMPFPIDESTSSTTFATCTNRLANCYFQCTIWSFIFANSSLSWTTNSTTSYLLGYLASSVDKLERFDSSFN